MIVRGAIKDERRAAGFVGTGWSRMTALSKLPEDLKNAVSVSEACERLGAHLHLGGPAPEPATRRVLADASYARAVFAVRAIPAVRDQLLAAAGTLRIAPPVGRPAAGASPTPLKLAANAAGSLLKWGMDGLKHAEPWVIDRRLAACAACEHQAPAPDTLIYRGAKVLAGKDSKICTLCHCLTNTKAAIATEQCPDRHPSDAGLSRWGDPWVPIENHPEGPW